MQFYAGDASSIMEDGKLQNTLSNSIPSMSQMTLPLGYTSVKFLMKPLKSCHQITVRQRSPFKLSK